ncbi:hypothetical protein B0H13DRAFT_1884642 [Mycena leptocephala]|nr:hypothetical protein B0H13DRAFT_1884642 [Mycena leptocephala]
MRSSLVQRVVKWTRWFRAYMRTVLHLMETKPDARTTEPISDNANVQLPITLTSAALPRSESATTAFARRRSAIRKMTTFHMGEEKPANIPPILEAGRMFILLQRRGLLLGESKRWKPVGVVTKDSEEEVNAVFERVEEGFAFMLELPNNDDDDEISIDEEGGRTPQLSISRPHRTTRSITIQELHVTFFLGANYSTTMSNLTRR